MIVSFRHGGLEAFYKNGSVRGIVTTHSKRLARILSALDVAEIPDDLDIPGFKLHPLKGKLSGYWSIIVNGNWRVVFRFAGKHVECVGYLDYH